MTMYIKVFLIILFSLIVPGQTLVAIDTTKFDDAKLQERYSSLTNELRCLVCQNETIAGSSSELAQDLRKQVAEQIKVGKSDQEIREYMTTRYGEFILYRPPNNGKTKLLWLAPAVFLSVLIIIFLLILGKKSKQVISDEDVL